MHRQYQRQQGVFRDSIANVTLRAGSRIQGPRHMGKSPTSMHAKSDSSMDKADKGAASLRSIMQPAVEVLTGAMVPEPSSKRASKPPPPQPVDDWRSPIYILVLAQVLAFVLSHGFSLPASSLSLHIGHPEWWQLVSSGFASSSWQHLAETVFLTYILGRLVERAHGAWGLWASYLGATVGANLATLWLAPVRMAAAPFTTSAGLVGLFTVGLLLPRLLLKPLEVLCLAPFVCMTIASRSAPLAVLAIHQGSKAGHWVHMAGACAASVIVWVALMLVDMYKRKQEQERAEMERLAREKQQQEQAAAMTDMLGTAAKAASQVARRFL